MDGRLVSFFQSNKWPDAELRVIWTEDGGTDDSTADSSSREDKTRELRLPVHRILLARSEFFEAQVRAGT
jgi:hypothetical protein